MKEFKKASKVLMPHEFEKLLNWLHFFAADKPELEETITMLNTILVS